MAGQDLGDFYTIPVILSFDGIDKQVNSSLGKAMGPAGKKSGKEFTKAFAASVEQDAKQLGDAYVKQYDRMKDATGKLRAEESKLKDLRDKGVTGGRLEAQSQRAEKARRDEARAVRETAGAYKDLEDAQKKAANAGDSPIGGGFLDKLKGLAGQAKSSGGEAASGFVEGFGGPVAELGTKGGPVGLALAAAAVVALGAGALIAKNVLAGMDQLQDQANVAAKLGLSPEQMKPIADASAKAYAGNFGESVSANMDAARVAIQDGLLPKGADSGATQKLVEQLTTVSTVLGSDIPETAKAAQQAIQTGLAPNATAAFDLIVKGQQAGLNKSDDWLDTLNEYGTQFRKLGLTGQEATGLISQAMQGGARDSDVAADALKEFSIRAVDGSKTTIDGFQQIGLNADQMAAKLAAGGQSAHDGLAQVLDGIRNIKDPVEQSRVSIELFGTQAEDLGGAFQHFDLSNAVGQLGQVDGAAQKAADTMGGTTSSAFESAQRTIGVAADGMQQKLAEAFGPSVENLAGVVLKNKDGIVDAFGLMAEAGAKFGGGLLALFGEVIQGVAKLGQGIGNSVGGVVEGFSLLVGAAATTAEAFGADGLAKTLRDGQSSMKTFADQAYGFGDGLNQTGADIASVGLTITNFSVDMDGSAQSAANAKAQVAGVSQAIAGLPDGKKVDVNAIVIYQDQNGHALDPANLITPGFAPAVVGEARRPVGGGRARGGVLPGYSPGRDNMLVPMSGGEGVLIPQAVRALGSGFVNGINAKYRHGYKDGGTVGPDVAAAEALMGTKYSLDDRTDCSGMVARVIARTLGLPETGLMSTQTAPQWLAALGFKPGIGGPGTMSVGWYNHGPNPNDGHMAMTLSDGENAESGGKNKVFTIGAGAAGANSPQFDQHMFLPNVFGEGRGASGSATASSGGSGGGVSAGGSSGGGGGGLASAIGGALGGGGGGGGGKGGGKGGLGQLGPLGDILGGALKETLGLDGSFLPDISNLMPVQMAGTLLSAFSGPLQGLVDGKLGIQQPGWQPGMPVNGVANDTGIGTSNSPFGIPDVNAPPMPPNGEHLGSGAAPGPTIVNNNDLSTTYQGTVGMDPETLRKQNLKAQDRGLARLTAPGVLK